MKVAVEPYAPLDVLKPVADDIWIVDGPVIRFGFGMFALPFPTRMTVVRLRHDELFIHSPTRLTPALRAEIESHGTPRWIIGPNRLHYSWIAEWKHAFPDATAWLAPHIVEQARGIDVPYVLLADAEIYPWDADIATMPVGGRYMTEYVFFHRPSRTLILTDLIENFESAKLHSWGARVLTRFGGVRDPHGGMPRDMRLTFDKASLRAAVETLIALEPQRIVVAHGRFYERNGTAELRRAFAWLLN